MAIRYVTFRDADNTNVLTYSFAEVPLHSASWGAHAGLPHECPRPATEACPLNRETPPLLLSHPVTLVPISH